VAHLFRQIPCDREDGPNAAVRLGVLVPAHGAGAARREVAFKLAGHGRQGRRDVRRLIGRRILPPEFKPKGCCCHVIFLLVALGKRACRWKYYNRKIVARVSKKEE